MKEITRFRRYFLLGFFSFLLMSLFQNCGQPGSIAINSEKGITDLSDDDTPVPPPPDDTDGKTYKDFDKIVTVNQSTNKVDILVVIDNSGSMELEQSNMANRFNSFLGRLQGLDWQVGIVTTDVRPDGGKSAALRDGRLLYFNRVQRNVIKSTDDFMTAQKAFSEVIQRPAGEGSGNEQGVKATYRALERAMETSSSNPNSGLIRQGAALSVILVSDADETVDGNGSGGDVSTFGEKNKPENLINFINSQYPGKTFKFNSIIVREGDQACLKFKNSINEGYGKNYQKLTNLTSGVLGSVCESDYGNQLSVIGDSTTELVRVVSLDCAPVDSDNNGALDLVVKDDNNNTLMNYTVNGRILTFNQQLPVGRYEMTYRCLVQ